MRYRRQLLVSAALCGMIANPAFAQGGVGAPVADSAGAPFADVATSNPDVDAGGDIVVTARRRAENIQKVPIAITALGNEMLQQRQIASEADLQKAVPGLTVRQSGNANQFNFSLRGQSVDTYTNSPPAILSYINEAQIVQHSASTFYDLENIQVLKGPQGTLFGRNSTGGAVLFQTARPSDEPTGYMVGRYGNYNSKYLEGALSLPLTDSAALRVAGAYTGGGAYVRNLANGKRMGKKDSKSLRGTLRFAPVSDLTNVTVVQHSWEGGNNVPTQIYSAYACGTPNLNTIADCLYSPLNPGFNAFIATHPTIFPGGVDAYADLQHELGPWVANVEGPSFHKARSTFVINTTTLDLSSDLTVKNILAYNKSKSSDGVDYDGTPYPIFTTGGTLDASGTSMLDPADFAQATEQFSNEIQIQGKAFDHRLTYVLGAYFLNQTYDVTSNLYAFGGVLPPLVFAYQARQKDHSRAIFAQGTYALTDRLNFTGGARYSWDKLSQTTGPDSAYFPFFGSAPESMKAHKPSWTLSLDFQLSPSVMLYVAQRGSWRTGGYNWSSPPIAQSVANNGNEFSAETTQDVELGVKYSGRELGFPVTLNVAGYSQWIKNVQRAGYVPGNGGSPGLVTTNVPKARVTGFEVDASIRPTDWLTLGGALAYTNARYLEADVLLLGLLTHYGPFADAPRWSGSAYIEAGHELPGQAGKIIARADVFAQSRFSFSNVGDTLAPETYISGYALVNGRLSWNNMFASQVSAAFYVRNLFNRKYFTGGNSTGPTLGTNNSVSGQPRMFGGELRFAF